MCVTAEVLALFSINVMTSFIGVQNFYKETKKN
jgi:hypothetical protein